jgi:plastocyanin
MSLTPIQLFSRLILGAAMCLILFSPGRVGAGEAPPTEIRFENHHFIPQNLTVAAGQEMVLKVVNTSPETIEFESFKLNREKAVSPGETISVHLPALSRGTYDFYDDFHQDVPQGTIVAK